ncbi:GNAT family N-acetyltransferase [Donghicola mangrovi]|nr:GNAT family N-acetyltransferase [Donghicola mangrovi]
MTMDTLNSPSPQQITLAPFGPEHIAGALRLSQQAGWPHRAEDWAMTLSTAQGVVALDGDQIVGTALCSDFGDVATLNMIIVDEACRGRGLGRRLMDAIIALGQGKTLRLVATKDGLPLYEKLGFVAHGQIHQYQGIAQARTPEQPVKTGRADLNDLTKIDQSASGMSRHHLLEQIAATGTVLTTAGGFAMLREFGRGMVVGPVVAEDAIAARALIDAAATQAKGKFLRIDLTSDALGGHMETLGLQHVGGGTAMQRPAHAPHPTPFKTFALVSQALG